MFFVLLRPLRTACLWPFPVQHKPQWFRLLTQDSLPACLLWEFGLEHRECLEEMDRCGPGTHTGLTLSLVGRVLSSQSHGIVADSGSAPDSVTPNLHLCSPCQYETPGAGHRPFSLEHIFSMSRLYINSDSGTSPGRCSLWGWGLGWLRIFLLKAPSPNFLLATALMVGVLTTAVHGRTVSG